MRKILAGFLATSMVVSMSTMISAAAYTPASFTATVSGTGTATAVTTTQSTDVANDTVAGTWSALVNVKSATIALTGGPSVTIDMNLSKRVNAPDSAVPGSDNDPVDLNDLTINAAALSPILDKASYPFAVSIAGAAYTGKLSFSGAVASVKFDQAVKLPASITGASVNLVVEASEGQSTTTLNSVAVAAPTYTFTGSPFTIAVAGAPSWNAGSGDELIENEKTGTFENVRVSDVIKSYGDGTPIPLTEDPIGVDEALNTQGGVQSGKTLYFLIRDDGPVAKLGEDKFWKLKISKGDNSKYVSAVTDVTKIFGKDLYNANTGKPETDTGADKKRHRYIKVELKEIYTDDEYKITLDMTLRAQSAAVDAGIATEGSEIKIKDFSFWMKNIVKDADNDWEVGIGGLMLNPVTNDWNNVTYFDEESDVAFMKFFGDSDTGKFYAKLSTKWAHEDYAAYFNDQDAFYFEFTGSPNLSSTSRADLHIYNPFVDEDGNETIDPSTATIYQVVDGDLIDVTDSFTYGEGENGEDAFITRTRFLGSYIICEKPVEEAAGDADIDDLMPDDLEVPEDVMPDAGNNGGGAKQPANTGRYI